jgi:ribosomal protein L7/L12
MPTSLNCPTCGAPLQYDGGSDRSVLCQHCGNTVLVPEEFQTEPAEGNGASLQSLAQEFDLTALLAQAGQWGEVAQLTRDGKKIEAIKLYRKLTGVGLKEAKDAIEQLAEGRVLQVAQTVVNRTVVDDEPRSAEGGQRFSVEDFLRGLQDLPQTDRKLEAVQQVRGKYNIGLKEAKDAVELLSVGQTREAAAAVERARGRAAAEERAAERRSPTVVVTPRPTVQPRPRSNAFALGCLITLLALGASFAFLLSGWPLSLSGSFRQALSAAQSDARVTAAFGGSVERGWGFVGGEISCGSRCSANYTFPVQGPRGAGEIWVRSDTLNDNQLFGLVEGTWVLDAIVTTPGGETIALGPDAVTPLTLPATPAGPNAGATAGAQARETLIAEQRTQTAIERTATAQAERDGTATAEAGAAFTATAQAQATMQVIVDSQVGWATNVISETFGNNANGWPTQRFDDGSLVLLPAVREGVYRWDIQPASGGHYWNILPGSVEPTTDFVAGVDVRLASGGEGGVYVYGLAFRAEGRDYGFFGLTNTGNYRVLGVFDSAIFQFYDFESAAIRTEPGAWNRLTVRGLGPDFVFEINGERVFAWNQPDLNDGRLGLGADIGREGADAVVEFDNFEVVTR